MDLKLTPRRLYGAEIVALSIWFLHGFVHGVLAATVAAIASWPLYTWFAARVSQHVGRHVTALIFTAIFTVFVLTPMVFALWALISESHALFLEIAAADERGMVFPLWLQGLPLLGRQSDLSSPGALIGWTQRTNATAFLGLAQSLGQFAARHFLILVVTILVLYFLYEQGESLACDFRRWLRAPRARYAWTVLKPARDALDALAKSVRERGLSLPVGLAVPFQDAAAAFEHVTLGKTGRAVLLPAS